MFHQSGLLSGSNVQTRNSKHAQSSQHSFWTTACATWAWHLCIEESMYREKETVHDFAEWHTRCATTPSGILGVLEKRSYDWTCSCSAMTWNILQTQGFHSTWQNKSQKPSHVRSQPQLSNGIFSKIIDVHIREAHVPRVSQMYPCHISSFSNPGGAWDLTSTKTRYGTVEHQAKVVTSRTSILNQTRKNCDLYTTRYGHDTVFVRQIPTPQVGYVWLVCIHEQIACKGIKNQELDVWDMDAALLRADPWGQGSNSDMLTNNDGQCSTWLLENTLLRTFPRSQCRSRPCCNLGAVADCPCLADQHQSCQIESCDWARLFVTSFSFFLAIDVLSEDWRESSGTSFSLFIACCNVSFNLRSQCGSGISWMLLKDTVTKWL